MYVDCIFSLFFCSPKHNMHLPSYLGHIRQCMMRAIKTGRLHEITCREWDLRRGETLAWASCNGPVQDAATQPDYKVSIVRDGSPTPRRPPRVRVPAPEHSSFLSLPPPSLVRPLTRSFPVEFHTHVRHTLSTQRERGNIFKFSHGVIATVLCRRQRSRHVEFIFYISPANFLLSIHEILRDSAISIK